MVRADAAVRFATKPDKAIGDPALWERAEQLIQDDARRGPASSYVTEAQGRHVLRAQDRHLHRRRARPRVADGDDPDRPDDAARALRPDLHRRGRASRSARSPSTARSTARSSGSSASSSSTSRGRSRCGSRRSRRSSSPSPTATSRRPRSSRACSVRAACAWRSTARRTGCSTRSGRRRSRRCRTWSCWATARSRRARPRRGPGQGSSRSPSRGTSSPTTGRRNHAAADRRLGRLTGDRRRPHRRRLRCRVQNPCAILPARPVGGRMPPCRSNGPAANKG